MLLWVVFRFWFVCCVCVGCLGVCFFGVCVCVVGGGGGGVGGGGTLTWTWSLPFKAYVSSLIDSDDILQLLCTFT